MPNVMKNKAMQRKLKARDAIDLAGFPKNVEGDYILSPTYDRQTIDGVDLCDSEAETWIWSVGLLKDGTLLASSQSYPDVKFYPSTDKHECVWVR